MNILHTFRNYLFNTENWAYHLIKHIPDTKNVVTAENFLTENFYDASFDFIQFPIAYYPPNSIKSAPFLDTLIFYVSNAFRKLAHEKYVTDHAKEAKVELIHSHTAPAAWKHLNIAKKLQIPHVVSFYGFDYKQLLTLEPIWKKRYTILFKEIDFCIAEGYHGKGQLLALGCPEEKIRVNFLGVEISKIPFIERIKSNEKLDLVQIASLREKKGHIYTLKAFIRALENCPNMTLTLIGVGKKPNELVEIVKGTIAENKVFFRDGIPLSQLQSTLSKYDAFIHPSCHAKDGDSEGGAPIVLLDAQANGMPVISTNHCDIPSEVIHKKTGWLAEEKNTDQIAEGIKYFYQMSNEEYRDYSQAARQHVEENFDIAKNAGKLKENIYSDLLLKKRTF
ncbi:glycosyltransferase [Sediminitomix flava]|uniref:Colanic acid/amylovoran biosynthesis glycosyltransferase n=1 Tax=Sediminitomix flava TaxID=379075 RepID=A0A315Z840_SEDFL|nr:glycosyltransferase [Sediminitomix flava]PWJ40916.1 colanic acid/amylovoran biosynthesis glycosyltransferase [Sediminitomix flava]